MSSVLDLFKSAADGACGVNREQRIVSWNRAAEAVLGYTSAEVMGHHCYEVLRGTGEDCRQFCRNRCRTMTMATRLDAVPTMNLRVRTKAGDSLWISITTLVVPTRQQSRAVLVHVFRDVSRYKGFQDAVEHLLADVAPGAASLQATPPDRAAATCLTRRERELLELLATGMSTRAMATSLHVSPSTVRNHIHNVFRKLDVHSRLEAVSVAGRLGVV